MGCLLLFFTVFKKNKKEKDQDLIQFQLVLLLIVSSFALGPISGLFFFQKNFWTCWSYCDHCSHMDRCGSRGAPRGAGLHSHAQDLQGRCPGPEGLLRGHVWWRLGLVNRLIPSRVLSAVPPSFCLQRPVRGQVSDEISLGLNLVALLSLALGLKPSKAISSASVAQELAYLALQSHRLFAARKLSHLGLCYCC